MDANPSTRPGDAQNPAPEPTGVRHLTDQRRYVVTLGAREVGFLEYSRIGRKVLFTHVEVEPAERRSGVASELVRTAMDDVREQELLARPLCDFVADWASRNPDYLDIIDPVDRDRLPATD